MFQRQDSEKYTIYAMNLRVTCLLGGLVMLAGCTEEVPPPSVHELVDDPIALEATVVRCSADRAQSRYREECINARQAVSIVAAREERERREAFEAQSAAKRAALRRTQEAAAEARRRAEEAERRRREAEYLAQFGAQPPPEDREQESEESALNVPTAVVPAAPENTSLPPAADPLPPPGSNAPTVEQEPPADLNDIREELRRRSESAEN